MQHSAKRQAVEPRAPLSFFKWTIVYFARALLCNVPLLESLYHTMFLYLDLAVTNDPRELYANPDTSPRTAQFMWWTRLRRLATPKLEFLFPIGSPFRDFVRWFGCLCYKTNIPEAFPLLEGNCVDPLFWYIHCAICADDFPACSNCSLSHKDAQNAWIRPAIAKRLRLRDLLDNVTSLSYFHAHNIWNDGWTIISNPVDGDCAIEIRTAVIGLIYGVQNDEKVQCDFFAMCSLLNQPRPLEERFNRDPVTTTG
jgi:hypothetical protein